MPMTIPEGVPIQLTPPPVMYEPTKTVGSRAFITIVASILGATIAFGTVVSSLGNAFFVGRTEYNTKNTQDAAEKVVATGEKVVVTEALKRIDLAMARQEAALNKLADAMDSIRQDMWRRK